jgi:hypothetical protein
MNIVALTPTSWHGSTRKKKARHAEHAVVVPLRFAAAIPWVEEVSLLGEWIVGQMPLDPTQTESELELVAPDIVTQNWIASCMHNQWTDAEICRFIRQHGAFRSSDWHNPKYALASDLPDDVKAEIRRVNWSGNVYLLRTEDFRNEWNLLTYIALFAGKQENPATAKEITRLLESVNRPLPSKQSLRVGGLLAGVSRIGGRHADSELEEGTQTKSARLELNKLIPLREQLHRKIFGPVEASFRRFFARPRLTFILDERTGPRFQVEVGSVLEVAYSTVLANFTKGWRRCKRPDCGNIFRVTDDDRKIFCSQYCGHLTSLRAIREKQRRKKKKPNSRRGDR